MCPLSFGMGACAWMQFSHLSKHFVSLHILEFDKESKDEIQFALFQQISVVELSCA